MYSDPNLVEICDRENTWHPGKRQQQRVSNEKSFFRCICPKCHKPHEVYMLWAGRGIPRKFCGHCKSLVAGYDDMILDQPSAFTAGQSRKKGRSAECE